MGLLFNQTRFIYRSFATYGSNYSTIYALATGGIRCALAVIRVSGPSASEVLRTIGRYNCKNLPDARKATLRRLYDPIKLSLIDQSIVLWFPGPRSFTGEDSCEFHVHGGPSVVSALLHSIGAISGCRMAEPGEFSRRAFLNGKLDLTEVEGLGDLIAAETELQRLQALKQMCGSLGKLYQTWRNRIAKCLANAEAFIDFGEDESMEKDILDSVGKQVVELIEEMRSHLKDERRGERLRTGVRIAILGRPNVGKSSLLNRLCKREAAIVSSIPGTTRDVVETCINLHGLPVVFADTAGIRAKSGDEIESEGMRRAVMQARMADLILLLIDYSSIKHQEASEDKIRLARQEFSFLVREYEEDVDIQEFLEKTTVVVNKVDLACDDDVWQPKGGISCKTGDGFETFLEELKEKVEAMCADPKEESVYLTQQRYRSHLEKCLESLTSYVNSSHSSDLALRTHYLKAAVNSIGYITGHVGSEEILDIIFRDFCIGK